MSGFADEQGFTNRIYEDYALAAKYVRRECELDAEVSILKPKIMGLIAVTGTDSEKLISVQEPIDPDVLEFSAEYFENLAMKRSIREKLTEIESNLSALALGLAVEIMPINGDRSLIIETATVSGLNITPYQAETYNNPILPAKGSIARFDVATNTLLLRPLLYTRAHVNQGYYMVPVLDLETGEPQVSIKQREPGYRDKPSSSIRRALMRILLLDGSEPRVPASISKERVVL